VFPRGNPLDIPRLVMRAAPSSLAARSDRFLGPNKQQRRGKSLFILLEQKGCSIRSTELSKQEDATTPLSKWISFGAGPPLISNLNLTWRRTRISKPHAPKSFGRSTALPKSITSTSHHSPFSSFLTMWKGTDTKISWKIAESKKHTAEAAFLLRPARRHGKYTWRTYPSVRQKPFAIEFNGRRVGTGGLLACRAYNRQNSCAIESRWDIFSIESWWRARVLQSSIRCESRPSLLPLKKVLSVSTALHNTRGCPSQRLSDDQPRIKRVLATIKRWGAIRICLLLSNRIHEERTNLAPCAAPSPTVSRLRILSVAVPWVQIPSRCDSVVLRARENRSPGGCSKHCSLFWSTPQFSVPASILARCLAAVSAPSSHFSSLLAFHQSR